MQLQFNYNDAVEPVSLQTPVYNINISYSPSDLHV